MYSRNLFVLDFAKNRPQKQVQERLRENILDNGGYKLEELTIDNTPVKNEKDQEAVIEAVLFTMGGAVSPLVLLLFLLFPLLLFPPLQLPL